MSDKQDEIHAKLFTLHCETDQLEQLIADLKKAMAQWGAATPDDVPPMIAGFRKEIAQRKRKIAELRKELEQLDKLQAQSEA